MKNVLPLLLVLAAACPALAQQSTPALVVDRDGKPEFLGLAKLQTEVRIFGYVAETSDHDDLHQSHAPAPWRATSISRCRKAPRSAATPWISRGRWSMAWRWKSTRPGGCSRPGRPPGHRPGSGRMDRGQQLPDPRLSHPGPRQPDGARAVRQRVERRREAARPTTCRCGYEQPDSQFSLRVEVVKPAAAPKVRHASLGQLPLRPMAQQLRRRNEDRQRDAGQRAGGRPARRGKAKRGGREIGRRARLLRRFRSSRRAEGGSAAGDAPARGASIGTPRARGAAHDRQREIELLKSLLAAWTAPVAGKPATVHVDLAFLRNALSPPRRFAVTRANISELTDALAGSLVRRRHAVGGPGADRQGGTPISRCSSATAPRPSAPMSRNPWPRRCMSSRPMRGPIIPCSATWRSARAGDTSTWRSSKIRRSSRPWAGRSTRSSLPR